LKKGTGSDRAGEIVGNNDAKVSENTPIGLASLVAVSVLAGGAAGVLRLDYSFRPEWYDYPSWLAGIVCAVFAVEVAVFAGTGRLFRRSREWMG
jgi:hypothetical protein